MKEEEKRLWTGNFILLCLIGFFTTAVQLLLSSCISLYIVHIGGAAAQAGAMTMGFALAAIAMRLWGGMLSDNKGRRFTMVLGAVIYLLGILGFMSFPQIGLLFFFRAVQGIGFSLANTAAGAAIADVVPASRMGEGMGYYGLGQAIAMGLGPLIGLALLGDNNFTLLFGVVAGILAITSILSMCVGYEKKTPAARKMHAAEDGGRGKAGKRGVKQNPIEKRALAPAAVQTLLTLAQSSITGFFTLFAVAKGLENAGMFFVIQAAAMFLMRIFTGKIADKKGTLTVVVPALGLGIIGFLILLFAPSGLLLTAGFFTGACVGMAQPALTALAVKRSDPERKGAANATFYLGMDIANGVGGYLWGSVIDYSGYSSMFGGCAILLAATIAVGIGLLGKGRKGREGKVI